MAQACRGSPFSTQFDGFQSTSCCCLLSIMLLPCSIINYSFKRSDFNSLLYSFSHCFTVHFLPFALVTLAFARACVPNRHMWFNPLCCQECTVWAHNSDAACFLTSAGGSSLAKSSEEQRARLKSLVVSNRTKSLAMFIYSYLLFFLLSWLYGSSL